MKRIFFPLAVILTLSIIFGPVGCGKSPSAVIPPGVVESISPSSGASKIASDTAVTIQFKSPIWASESTVTPGAEPQQLNSSELIDRFRIIDAATGEIVQGTITIEDGAKLTFKLPAGESWKPDSTYWIEGTADASPEEAYEEGTRQNLFLSAFTTQDLNADQFPVHHPIDGSWPTLLSDIAYDVDTSSSLSFDELKDLIDSAPGEADGTSLTKFHFWPNIINLTEVYYAEDDHALFNDILEQLLENEPNSAQLKSQLTAQVVRGDRVFVARDFISSLMYGFTTYWEVHYGLLINLDNPDQTGARNPYVQEILVHEYSAEGLPLLHDPHTEKLASLFASSTDTSLGKAWDLCLRGNLKKNKYNAIVVDKLAEAPDAEFYIERVELTCGCDFFSDFDTSIPDVPGKPRKPPPHPQPVPIWERQPIPNPNPPRNPQAPPNPEPGPAGPPVEPWPFPVDPFPLPQPAEEEPGIEAGEQQSERCERPEVDCSDQSAVTSKLEVVKSELRTARENRRQDRNTFERFRYQYGWYDDIENVKFNDPCLNELLGQLRQDIAPLLAEIGDINNEMRALWQQFKEKRESMGGDPVLQAFNRRDRLWSFLFEFRGEGSEQWHELTQSCQVFVPSISFGIAAIGMEPQNVFQDKVSAGLMNGQTWETAVNSALTAMEEQAKSVAGPEWAAAYAQGQWAAIWQGYANCYKQLLTRQLEIALNQEFGDSLTPEQLSQMINVMLNGRSALTEEQKRKYDEIQEELEALRRQMDEKAEPKKNLFDALDKKRQDFEAKAWRCCFLKSRENINRLFQEQLILEAYLKWCQDPNNEEALPRIPVYPGEYLQSTEYEAGEPPTLVEDPQYCNSIAQRRFCAILCKIRDDSEFNGFQGLRAYARWLISCNCEKYPCDKLVEPCDPECEDCTKQTQPPASITPPPTWVTPPSMVTPPPSTVIPPTDTLPPTQEVLRAEASANAESLRDEKGCSSTLTISYSAQDLTGGSYPVTNVVLMVNGQVWHDSGTTSQVSYQNSVSEQVGCGQTFNIQVTANNKNGQTVIVPGSITTPVP